MVAALYVEKGGVYYGLPGVDPWDEERDARLYDGPWRVVAHPPCAHLQFDVRGRLHRAGLPLVTPTRETRPGQGSVRTRSSGHAGRLTIR